MGLDYIVNAVVTPDNDLYKVRLGIMKAHREGVKFAEEVWGIVKSQN